MVSADTTNPMLAKNKIIDLKPSVEWIDSVWVIMKGIFNTCITDSVSAS